jgi:hypothetical protein
LQRRTWRQALRPLRRVQLPRVLITTELTPPVERKRPHLLRRLLIGKHT